MSNTDLTSMTIPQLRAMAQTFGIPVQSKAKKSELVETLTGAVENAATAIAEQAAADQAAAAAKEAAAAAKQAEKEAAAAAKQAEKDAKAAAEKLAAEQEAAATLTQIDAIESDARALTGETEINLSKLAADFLRLYPLAPWKVRGIGTDVAAITTYYTSLGVSAEDDTLSFPTVIRQAMCAAMWAGTMIEDKPAMPAVEATEDTEAVPEAAAIIIPTKVRDMINAVMGRADGTPELPAIGAKVPVSHMVAMTGAATPTIARDRRALGLASETRQKGQPKVLAGPDTEVEGGGNGGNGHNVDSLAGIVASIDDVDLLRSLVTMAEARIATLTGNAA